MNSRFGMATVCPQGFSPNKKYRAKRGQRECLKDKFKISLAQLQQIAHSHGISVFKRRKDGTGFTKKPLKKRELKTLLTKHGVSYGQPVRHSIQPQPPADEPGFFSRLFGLGDDEPVQGVPVATVVPPPPLPVPAAAAMPKITPPPPPPYAAAAAMPKITPPPPPQSSRDIQRYRQLERLLKEKRDEVQEALEAQKEGIERLGDAIRKAQADPSTRNMGEARYYQTYTSGLKAKAENLIQEKEELQQRLEEARRRANLFGMATVCPPGYAPNPKWRRKPGQRQCLKVKRSKPTLKDVQRLAKQNGIPIYKLRKDGKGYTKTPVTARTLKARMTSRNIPWDVIL